MYRFLYTVTSIYTVQAQKKRDISIPPLNKMYIFYYRTYVFAVTVADARFTESTVPKAITTSSK